MKEVTARVDERERELQVREPESVRERGRSKEKKMFPVICLNADK